VAHKISLIGFGGLRDLNDGRICWVMKFQRRSVLVIYEISMIGFLHL